MNKKQLFLSFSAMVVAGIAMADQDKKPFSKEDISRALNHPGFSWLHRESNLFNGCRDSASSHCNLVIEHLTKSLQHNEGRSHIQQLEYQIRMLSSAQLQQPIKNRLNEAQKKHPYGNKSSYWTILSEQEQTALLEAAAEIATKDNQRMSDAITQLHSVLNH